MIASGNVASQKQSKQTKIDAASVSASVVPSQGTLANLSRCSRHYLKSSATQSVYPHWELIEPWRCGAGETWGWPMLVMRGSADFNGCGC